MRFFLYIFIFNLYFSCTITSNILNKFNITIKTPGNELPPTQTSYKSIHVKYTFPSNNDQWNIVAIEPFTQISNDIIQQITVHLCQTDVHISQENHIWYNDETYCNNAESMLIYQWTSYEPISTFRITDGFQLDKTKSIVLTVSYSKEQRINNDQTGIIFYISTSIPRFHVGTMLVGNKQNGIRFSCRSSNYPRLLHSVKPLFPRTNNVWWRIYVIRNRSFRRKLIQLAVDSTIFLKQNQTDIQTISSDVFLIPGDYIIIECTQISEINCKFLIFYTYQNHQYDHFNENDHFCQDNNYPDLFKLIPSREIYESNQIPSYVSSMDGLTIFLLVSVLLFVIWISIIIGCVIMRRIRGLVNFRTEPPGQFSKGKTNPLSGQGRTDQHHQRIAAEGDHIAQLDVEHMGLMS